MPLTYPAWFVLALKEQQIQMDRIAKVKVS